MPNTLQVSSTVTFSPLDSLPYPEPSKHTKELILNRAIDYLTSQDELEMVAFCLKARADLDRQIDISQPVKFISLE